MKQDSKVNKEEFQKAYKFKYPAASPERLQAALFKEMKDSKDFQKSPGAKRSPSEDVI